MIKRTEREILDQLEAIWPKGPSWSKTDRKVTVKEDQVKITVQSMYEAPGLGLKTLIKLSEFFGTQNISDPDTFGSSGCESCDYGSSYGFTLVIRPEGHEN